MIYLIIDIYFTLGRGSKYCNGRVYVCLSVRSHIAKSRCRNFAKFPVRVNCGVTRCPLDDNAVRGVLLVLWLTLCLSIIGRAKTMPKGLYSLWGSTGGQSLMSTIALILCCLKIFWVQP